MLLAIGVALAVSPKCTLLLVQKMQELQVISDPLDYYYCEIGLPKKSSSLKRTQLNVTHLELPYPFQLLGNGTLQSWPSRAVMLAF